MSAAGSDRDVAIERHRLGRCAPSASEALLLRACLLPGDAAVAAWHRWRSAESLATTSWRSHHLMPLAAHRLGDELDAEAIEFARARRRRSWVEGRRVVAVVPDIVRLVGDGIEPLVFKGAALADTVYPPGLRSMGDLDIAIGGSQHDAALDALLAAGWVPAERLAGREVARAMTLVDELGHSLDLHRWPLFPRSTRAADAGVVARSVPGDGMLASCRVPAVADAIVLSLVHGLEPLAASAVRWPVDVAMLAASTGRDDRLWDEVDASARELGVAHLVGLGLDWCRAELGLEIDPERCARLRAEPHPPWLRVEWALKRQGLSVESRVRYYVDGSRAVGEHPSPLGYARLRRSQFRESGGAMALVRRRIDRANAAIAARRR